MPNIAAMFRQEIIRLARRQIRSQTLALRKSSAQQRRQIAELKRQAAKLKSEVARLTRQSGKDIRPQQSEDESANIRFSARSVIAQRKRLGLTAVDFGRLLGVSDQSVFNWERGRSRPRSAQLTALGSLRSLGKREVLTRIEQMGLKASKRRAVRR